MKLCNTLIPDAFSDETSRTIAPQGNCLAILAHVLKRGGPHHHVEAARRMEEEFFM